MTSESVGSWPPPPPSPPAGGVATPRLPVSPAVVRYTQTSPDTTPNIQSSPLKTGERGNCFKCKQVGHWARNCPMNRGSPASPPSPAPTSGSGRSEFPDFRCSCGTTVHPKQSHTEKNPNRWFYSCRDCYFWKWCDMVVSPGRPMHGSASPLTPNVNRDCGVPKTPDADKKHLSSISKNLEHAFGASAGANPSPIPDRRQPEAGSGNCPAICRCGILCRTLTSHTPQNPNRRFCKCAKQMPEGCGFFEWCDEHVKKKEDNNLCTTPHRLGNALGTSSPTSASIPANAGIINASNVPIRQDCGAKIPLEVDNLHGVSSVSCPECACGAGKCCVAEVSEGEYVGRLYYTCPIKKGQGACNFFQWVNPEQSKNSIVDQSDIPSFQLIPNIPLPQKKDSSHAIEIEGPSLSPNKGAVKHGACYRCGQDGHWANECRASQRTKYG